LPRAFSGRKQNLRKLLRFLDEKEIDKIKK